jgi:hypothetical protein
MPKHEREQEGRLLDLGIGSTEECTNFESIGLGYRP